MLFSKEPQDVAWALVTVGSSIRILGEFYFAYVVPWLGAKVVTIKRFKAIKVFKKKSFV